MAKIRVFDYDHHRIEAGKSGPEFRTYKPGDVYDGPAGEAAAFPDRLELVEEPPADKPTKKKASK